MTRRTRVIRQEKEGKPHWYYDSNRWQTSQLAMHIDACEHGTANNLQQDADRMTTTNGVVVSVQVFRKICG
jgi:hypothetical protein